MSKQRIDFKIVLLGAKAVGKTCLLDRYVHDRFETTQEQTIGAAFCAKRETILGRTVTTGIWDTAGEERYEAMSKIYYRGAKAAVVCIDLTSSPSFDRATFWIDQLLENEPNCKVYMCGTKLDLVHDNLNNRAVQRRTLENYGKENNCQVFETSSKTGMNVKKLFQKVIQDLIEYMPDKLPDGPPTTAVLETTAVASEMKCGC